jgi:polysaccharide biosynthesis transport protein
MNDTPLNLPNSVNAVPAEPSLAGAGGGGGINLRYIYASVRANLQLVLALVGATIVVSVLVTFLQKPVYTALTTLQINNSSSTRVFKKSDDEDQGDDASNASDTDLYLRTQVDILKSRSLAIRVAERLRLGDNPAFFAAEGVAMSGPGSSAAVRETAAVGLLRKHIDVTLPHDSRIATVTFESRDPALSALVVNTYATEFIAANLQRKFDSSGYAREFLARQLAEVKVKYEASEQALNDYARSAGLITTDSLGANSDSTKSGASVTTSSLVQLNQAANEAKTRRILAEARWREISVGNGMNATEIVSNASVSQLLGQKAAIEAAIAEERSRHLDAYPTVQSKQAQLATINQQLQGLINSIRNAVKAEYLVASKSEQDLLGQVEALKANRLNEQDRNVHYTILAHEQDTNKQLYDGLLQRYKELNASAGVSASNIAVIDTAIVPSKPSSPNIPRNLLFGLIGGVLLSAVVLAIKEQFDDTVRIPEDIDSKLGLALLGVIPVSHGGDLHSQLEDRKSAISEAYNSLGGALLYSTASGLPGTLMVTSAQPAEGKSTSSFAIANVLARMGKRVVLIDADMRRPSLHRQVDSDNQTGLSMLLSGQAHVRDSVLPSGLENLFFITSGPIPPAPTELLASHRMKEAIDQARELFDVVIIDCPPVLGLADAPMVAGVVEGVIFIAEADRGRHGGLKSAINRLRSVRANVLGGVLTKFDPVKGGKRESYYYGYSYYNYQYGYEDRS